jgi:hypothetical protein
VFVSSGSQQRVEFSIKNIREIKMNTHVVVVVVDVVVGLGTVCVCSFLIDVSKKLKLPIREKYEYLRRGCCRCCGTQAPVGCCRCLR